MLGNCTACGFNSNLDKHHIKTRGSGGKDNEWNIAYLCRPCHSELHRIGTHKMAQKHYTFEKFLIDNGWNFIDEFGVIKLRRVK